MIDFFRKLFDTSDFPQRWNCGNWTEGHGWLHIISDILIFAAYFAIPLILIFFLLKKRQELVFSWVVVLFATFILSCGLTHLIDATIFWNPWYRFSGALKGFTAIISWATVVALVGIIPKALKLPGVVRLREELEKKGVSEAHAIDEARKSKEQLELILDSAAEGIVGIDSFGRCTFCNRAAAGLLKFKNSEFLVGKHFAELVIVNEGGEIDLLSDEVHFDDYFFSCGDGTTFPVEFWSHPIRSDESRSGAVITFVDIAIRKESETAIQVAREKAEEANLQKTQFLANISHEIRTPMNAIIGFGELLEGLTPSKKAKHYLSAIQSSGHSLLDLINDLLDLSKIDAGRVTLNPEPMSLRDTIKGAKDMVTEVAREKGISVVTTYDDVPDVVVLDRTRFRQILLNFLTNSIKFSTKGVITVRMEGKTNPAGNSVDLAITVQDNGCGIDQNQIKSIFEPFYQAHSTDGSVHSGTGLGLSISNRLAELMNGLITVESEVGKGSAFTLHLDNLEISDQDSMIRDDLDQSKDSDLNNLKPSRILVADDNKLNRDLFAEIFAPTHHEVHFAENGEEAVILAESIKPDLVILDIRMPKMDGRQARVLIQSSNECSDTPVIAVTASSLLNREKTLRKEFDGYIRKPFTRSILYQTLTKFIPLIKSGDVETKTEVEKVDSWEVGINEPSAEWKEGLYPELVGLLENEYIEIQNTGAMNSVLQFAMTVEGLGVRYSSEAVKNYGQELRHSADLFKVSKVETQLLRFPDLVNWIDQASD